MLSKCSELSPVALEGVEFSGGSLILRLTGPSLHFNNIFLSGDLPSAVAPHAQRTNGLQLTKA
jgi:hypothetical protein